MASHQGKASIYRIFLCLDCGKDTNASNEYYHLRLKVWLAAHPAKLEMLCLDCVERRLGRPLTGSDFTTAPINRESAKICVALIERLKR